MLRIGTDCSGMEAPIEALKQLNIPYHHVFSCDIDKYCRETIHANHTPDILFHDMFGRDLDQIPDIDLYVCGFPCQPFTTAGDRQGFLDKRGSIFWKCIEVIRHKRPKYFILENVKGILSANNGEMWSKMLDTFEALCDDIGYTISYKLLNTRSYGIPQNRERMYIVGQLEGGIYEFPELVEMASLDDYIDWTNVVEEPLNRTYYEGRSYPEHCKIIDLNFLQQNKFINSHRWSPCLNTQHGIWIVPLHRKATIGEYLGLQGFKTSMNIVVSKTQMIKQIGNSMSVNVLVAILSKLLNVV